MRIYNNILIADKVPVRPAKEAIKFNLKPVAERQMTAYRPNTVPLHYSAWRSVHVGRFLFVILP